MADFISRIVFSLLSLSASGFSQWRGPQNEFDYCQMTGDCRMPWNEGIFQRSRLPISPDPRMSHGFARPNIRENRAIIENINSDFAFLDDLTRPPNIREHRANFEDIDSEFSYLDDLTQPPSFGFIDEFARPALEFAQERRSQRPQLSESWHLKQEPFCGQSIVPQKSRIVGGSKASFGQFPWQAQIWTIKSPDSEPTYTCGGTLVSNELIVTAGHCVHYQDPEQYLIKLGRLYVNEKDETCIGYEQRYKVVDLVVHPDFNKRHLTNDIAVMWIRSEKYNQTVHFADHIVPACLPELSKSKDEFYEAGSFGIVSGWGLLNETAKKGSKSLQHVALPILTPDICLGAYGKFVDMDENKQFCAGNDRGQDACAGDSGGPFVMNKNGHHYLVGVVSYGRGCARPEYPGVYSNVYHYLPWINQVVGDRKEQEMEMTTNESQNSIIISSNEIPTIRPVTTTTTTTPPPPPPPPKEVVEKSTEVFCPSQYELLRCSGATKITVTKAVFALDSVGHCGQRQRSDRSLGGDCSLDQAEAVPKHVCDGKRTCWVYHNIFHQDPCPGQVKYSVIHYKCE